MKAGFAREKIKLAPPLYTLYSRFDNQPVHKILDPLYSHCTVWEHKKVKGAIFTLDMLAVPWSFTREIRKKLEKRGFAPQAVSITASHSHTTPNFLKLRECRENPGLKEEIKKACLQAVSKAEKNMSECTLFHSKINCGLNVNRREIGRLKDINDINAPSGNVDPEVKILHFKNEKNNILLINYSGHPITLTSDWKVISADYPGRMIKHLENTLPYTHAQFLQGPCGDVNIKIHGDESVCEKAGKLLAEKVKESLQQETKIILAEPSVCIRTFFLPLDIQGTLQTPVIKKGDEALSFLESYTREVQKKTEKGKKPSPLNAEMQKISFDGFKILFLPGENFNDIGKLAKRYGYDMVVAYSNTCEPGYIPTQKAFREGGYETDISYAIYDHYKFSPEVEKIVTEELKNLLEKN
jgi:hypothetical protein